MLKKVLFALFCLLLICEISFGIPKNYFELLADPAFSNKTPEQQLELISKKLEAKEWQYEDMNNSMVFRVFWELFKGEKDYGKKIEVYSGIKKKCTGLPQMIEIDLFLMTSFFASTPEGQKADFRGMLKVMGALWQDERLFWHALAKLEDGLLALHISSHPEFSKMDKMGQLAFLNDLVKENLVKDLTASQIAVQIAMEFLLDTPPEKRKERIQEIEKVTDPFTAMAIGEPDLDKKLEWFGKNRGTPGVPPKEFRDPYFQPIQHFMTLPEFKGGNLVTMMKAVRKFSSETGLGFPYEARFQMALLAAFMASDGEFRKADPKGRLTILKKLVEDEAIGELVIEEHTSRYVQELLVNTPPDQQDNVFSDLSPEMDMFTRTAVETFLKNSRSAKPKQGEGDPEGQKSEGGAGETTDKQETVKEEPGTGEPPVESPKSEEPKKETENVEKELPKIVTGISCADGTAYIFLGNGTFFHYDQKEKKVDEGHPQPVDNQTWPGLEPYWKRIVSSCIGRDDKFLFLLSGGEYLSYDMEKDRVEPGFPKPIGGKTMPGMEPYADQIRFSVSWAQDTVMFFLKDGTSVEYDLKKKKLVSAAPLPVDEKNWPGLGKDFDKVYAIADWSDEKFLAFLDDGTFIQYDVATNHADDGYPKPIDDANLPGFPNLVGK